MASRKEDRLGKTGSGSTIGPTVEDLKMKFATGSVPLQNDFSDLIDIADCGRKATGLSPTQDGNPGAGFSVDGTGKISLKVKEKAGLSIDDSGVYFDFSSAFPSGTILMFYSKNKIPAGWAICDGKNGTPNLVGRFVVGASTSSDTHSDVTLAAGGVLSGSTNSVTESVTLSSTALTVEELPALALEVVSDDGVKMLSGYMSFSSGGLGGSTTQPNDISKYKPWTARTPAGQKTGQGHTHTATCQPHSHSVSVDMPYYSLIYIMKI